MSHPNIVTAYDADEAQGMHFLVMKCVEGQDLSSTVRKRGPLAVATAVDYVLQAARGLEFAHGQGIIHRDIKPANLLVDPQGNVKILDMGLARVEEAVGAADKGLTQSGQVMGTLDYMAPEQAMDTHQADARADIYSLGCTLYYLLAGRAPYGGETYGQKIVAHREEAIPSLAAVRPDVPEELDGVFQKMLAKTPEERPQSMAEVILALESCPVPHDATWCPLPATPAEEADTLSLRDAKVGTSSEHVEVSLMDKPLAHRPPSTLLPAHAGGTGTVRGRPSRGPKAFLGTALAVAFLAVVLGIVISLRTREGTLIVEIAEPGVNVQILSEEGKLEIERPNEEGTITISVDPGKHRLRLEKDGVEVFAREFTIDSGGTETIHATWEPQPSESPTEPKNRQKPCPEVTADAARLGPQPEPRKEATPAVVRSGAERFSEGEGESDHLLVHLTNKLGVQTSIRVDDILLNSKRYLYKGADYVRIFSFACGQKPMFFVELAEGVYLAIPARAVKEVHLEKGTQVVTLGDGRKFRGRLDCTLAGNGKRYDLLHVTQMTVELPRGVSRDQKQEQASAPSWALACKALSDTPVTVDNLRFCLGRYQPVGWVEETWKGVSLTSFGFTIGEEIITPYLYDFPELSFSYESDSQYLDCDKWYVQLKSKSEVQSKGQVIFYNYKAYGPVLAMDWRDSGGLIVIFTKPKCVLTRIEPAAGPTNDADTTRAKPESLGKPDAGTKAPPETPVDAKPPTSPGTPVTPTSEPETSAAKPPMQTPDDEKAIAKLKELDAYMELNDRGLVKVVEADGTTITDDDLALLAGLPSLEVLQIDGGSVTAAGMVHLKGLSQLQSLYLTDLKLGDAALANLSGLTNLESLTLEKTGITGAGLVHLKPLAKLCMLNLSDNAIDDDGLAHLEGLTNIDTPALRDTKVTGAGLVHFKPLARLRVLNLNHCAITDESLEHLSGLQNLRMLHVRKSKVTKDNVYKFKEKMPRLAVYYEPEPPPHIIHLRKTKP